MALAAIAAATSATATFVPRPKQAGGELEEGVAAARPVGGLERLGAADYRATIRAYPAAQVKPAWLEAERQTFARLQARTPRVPPDPLKIGLWQNYGPQEHATEPGVLNFSGAPYNTASRTASLVVSPTCGAFPHPTPFRCRMWAGPVGGGVWRTDDALAPDPVWEYVSEELGINSVGVYRSTWAKLQDKCVDNTPPNICTTPGVDAFLGRGISEIVVAGPGHLFVGSAVSARSISHVIIGPEAQVRDEPGANPTGLYESIDGGTTFKPVWLPYDGTPANTPVRRGVMDVGLDPLDPGVVYASAVARGLWRRCPTGAAACGGEASSGTTDFKQVFKPRLVSPLSRERTQFDTTVKNSRTRIYLTTGELGGPPHAGEAPSSFWRTDNANQTSAALLGSEPGGPGVVPTGPSGPGIPFPATYSGWQLLTANTTASPYWATRNFCTGQCSYDQDVFTPKNPLLPDTGYGRVVRLRRAAVLHEGRRLRHRHLERPRRPLLHHGRRSRPGEPQPDVHGHDLRRSERARGLVRSRARRSAVSRLAPLDPPRPARDRDQPVQADAVLRGLGRRDQPDLGVVLQPVARVPLPGRPRPGDPVPDRQLAPPVPAPALARAVAAGGHQHPAREHDPVRERRRRPAEAVQRDRRYAGQRHMDARQLRLEGLASGDLRRRRQRRSRHGLRPVAGRQRRAGSPTRTRRSSAPIGPTRSSRGSSTSGAPGRSARAGRRTPSRSRSCRTSRTTS